MADQIVTSISTSNEVTTELGTGATWYSVSKTKPPQPSIDLVPRPRLLDILNAAVGKPLSLIVAPAGFGKSTLLSQWIFSTSESAYAFGWINLDETDSDLRQFLAYIVFALNESAVDFGKLTIAAENGFPETSSKSIVASVIASIQHSSSRVILVLDDYHRVQSSNVDAFLVEMLQQCRDSLHVVISSRERPEINSSALLAAGEAVEIDAAYLRFSNDEMRSALGEKIGDDQFASIKQKVEGWPVAVQLTKLLVSGADDTNAAVSKLHGYHGHLASYLTEQVISKMPSELREFVLKTSILERFNSDLANAVTDRENGLECIRALEPLQALLVPLDDDWEWYRYHHLFAECLQDLLRQEGQDAFVKLHKKAASKFCELGLFADAVRHAREARDFDQCASIIIEAGGWELILFGGIGYLAGLMANIPEKEMRKYPRLLYARSYLAMKHGDIPLARAFYDAAILREKELEDVSDGVRDKLSVGMLLDIYEETPITKPEANVLERYLEQIGETDAVSRGINYCLMSLRDLAFGDFTSGYECAQKAMKAMREGDTVLGLNYCFVHAGMNALHNGKYQIATANFDKAGELAADNFGADSGLRYFTDLCTYALLYWKSDLDEKAAKNLKRAVSYVQDYDGWSEYYMLGFDALFHRAIQKNAFDEALEVLRELRRTAAERNLDRLAKFADALELRMLVTQNKLTKASMIFENITTWFDVGALGKSNTTWQPGITAACSCACFLAAIGKYEQAIEYIDKGLAVTEKIGAEFYRLRILLVKATIMKQADRMGEAVEALLRALDLGAQNGLRQPFIVNDIEKLLRVTRSQLRFDEKRLVTADFLSKVLERDDNSQQQVSNRETEVLEELATGKSNKEIARALDMTENTVKFHLKNIFSKLNVSRRVQAIEKARQLDLID